MPTSTVFSEYDIKEMCIKFDGDTTATSIEDVVGSVEEELEVKTITKKCRGVVVKQINKSTGNGKLKITAHFPYAVYTKAYGMDLAALGLKTGVNGYGINSKHPHCLITEKVLDEDDNEKYKAYPNAVVQSAISRKIEVGGEEVAELEMELALLPDENGICMYEALATGLDTDVANSWMKAFTPELVKATSA